LLFTDINLVAKSESGTQKVWAWALDMGSLAPLSGVTVKSLVKSGRAVATCTTDRHGGCVLDGPAKGAPDPAQPFALVAAGGDDVTYLRYADLKTEIAEEEVGGAPFDDPSPYRAAVYSDRGVYRPGETAHLAAIVRDRE